MGRRDQCHAFQCLDSALCLTGLGGFGLEAAHEVFHMCPLGLLFLKGLLLLCQLFSALNFKGAVVAAVGCECALVQMDNLVAYCVDKVAIVGNQPQCAGIGLQPLLQPQAGVQVQVVGGFVQQ